MSGYQVQLTTLAEMSDRLTRATDDLATAFDKIDGAAADAGASTATLHSVVDQVVLGVTGVLGELEDAAVNLDATRATYQDCDEEAAGVFNRMADLPPGMTTRPGTCR